MRRYGQFCPVAKSAEILGDPWSLLIVREMLLGSDRFTQLQKGMPRISPTVLNKRLKELEANGVIVKRRLQGQRGHEYRMTPAGRELAPVVEALAVWGMRWAREEMDEQDMDVTFLMFDIQRNIDSAALPDGEIVLCFQFPDLDQFGRWWLVCDGDDVDLCYDDPGKDVGLYVIARSGDLIGLWMGDIDQAAALRDERLMITGDAFLTRTFSKWFPLATSAAVPRPTPAEKEGAIA